MKHLLLTLLLIFAAGCQRSLHLTIPSSAKEAADEEALLTRLNELSPPRSARVLFSTELTAYGSREHFQQTLSFEKPDKLRVEIFAPGVHQLLFLAVTNGEVITAVDLQNKSYTISRSSRRVFAELLNLPLTAEELMHWSFASLLPGFEQCPNGKVYEIPENELLIQCKRGEREFRFKSSRTLFPRMLESSLEGGDLAGLNAVYRYSPSGEISGISFSLPDAQGTLEIKRLERNVTFANPSAIFSVNIPSGFHAQLLDE